MIKVKKLPRSRYPDKLSAVVRISSDMRARLNAVIDPELEITESDIVREALDKFLPKLKKQEN
jgi:hypothetical protein